MGAFFISISNVEVLLSTYRIMKNYLKIYYEKNKKTLKAKAELRKDDIKKRSKIWREDPVIKKRIKEYNLNYRQKNLEKFRNYMKHYMRKSDVREKYNLYVKEKRQKNLSFRLARNMQNRIWIALKFVINNKEKTFRKTNRTKELLGCTEKKLLEFLRNKYQPGMRDDNYGLWHVDHIKPVKSFDLTNPLHVKECFHYTNLQPLWASDNLKKSCKTT